MVQLICRASYVFHISTLICYKDKIQDDNNEYIRKVSRGLIENIISMTF